ncbi:MAG: NAD(P)H-binding protein [Pseudonocardia sp.]|nr:NAD(P)H-binding protein [Pseudonocardia sp.]
MSRVEEKMKVAVLGATGRTGRLVVGELLARGHDVVALARDPAAAGLPDGASVVAGHARDAGVLRSLVAGADAVVSTLGPGRGDRTLHRDVAPVLVQALRAEGVRRFVGVSGAGIDVPGDRKSRRDRFISGAIGRFGGDAVRDKVLEYGVWAASGLDWTLVRPPRLTDAPVTGRVEHHAHTSPRSTSIGRGDLAVFVVGCVELRRHVGEAPLVAKG